MMTRRSHRLAACCLAVAAIGASGCASGAGDHSTATAGATRTTLGSTSGDSPPQWPDDHCGIVDVAAISEAVGETVTAAESPPFGCSYSSGAVIEYFNNNSECQIAEASDHDSTVVDGLASHAAFAAGNTDEVLAVTLVDGRCVFVHGQYRGEGAQDTRLAVARAIVLAVAS
ncbi:MAG: hypothetical protein JWN39_22 [Ilumatobacteraceae bacterium]|nr:hypothetical protein [Ilumatobacteraceae bacterium]